jgi:hypothetical protein
VSKRELRKWQFAYIQKCREAFGVGYAGFAFYSNRCKKPGGSRANQGWAQGEPRYERGQVQIRRDLAPDDAGYEVLTHETLHAALGPQGQAVDRILDLVPKKHRAHALELWRDGNEAAVTRLARGLTPLLRATERKS